MAVAAAAVTILKDFAGLDLMDAVRQAAAAINVEPNILKEFRRNVRRQRASKAAIEIEKWCIEFYHAQNGTPSERAKKILEVAKHQKG